ncbi:MAG: inward rectifier potassium channel-domain-containing protein [Monoraphidium minutum]|nr:MAG: inward rectifier potassium channel-domain-containing protein [Monoraphidium minutum]
MTINPDTTDDPPPRSPTATGGRGGARALATSTWARRAAQQGSGGGGGAYENISGRPRPLEDAALDDAMARPRLMDQKQRQHTGIDRYNVPLHSTLAYYSDLFHTLLHLPLHRFVAVFFAIYMLEYTAFALAYLAQPDACIEGVGRFANALWFSVQTASTIGYGRLVPSPQCPGANAVVMLQAITSSLVDYCMMGVVFARFSSPSKRALSMRFSETACVYRGPDGLWRLAVRVANMRKHLMLKPNVQVLLGAPDGGGFTFEELALESPTSALANIKLGLAAALVHVIDAGSPLWRLSVDGMAAGDMEVVVFLDGIDSTSSTIQARHHYCAADVRVNERFASLSLMVKGKRLGLDFSEFDTTVSTGGKRLGLDFSEFDTTVSTAFDELHDPFFGDAAPPPGGAAGPHGVDGAGGGGGGGSPRRRAPVSAERARSTPFCILAAGGDGGGGGASGDGASWGLGGGLGSGSGAGLGSGGGSGSFGAPRSPRLRGSAGGGRFAAQRPAGGGGAAQWPAAAVPDGSVRHRRPSSPGHAAAAAALEEGLAGGSGGSAHIEMAVHSPSAWQRQQQQQQQQRRRQSHDGHQTGSPASMAAAAAGRGDAGGGGDANGSDVAAAIHRAAARHQQQRAAAAAAAAASAAAPQPQGAEGVDLEAPAGASGRAEPRRPQPGSPLARGPQGDASWGGGAAV